MGGEIGDFQHLLADFVQGEQVAFQIKNLDAIGAAGHHAAYELFAKRYRLD